MDDAIPLLPWWAAASTPTSTKPAWVTDEKASIRFTFVWTTARTDPTKTVAIASTHTTGRQSSTRRSSAVASTRSSAVNAATLPADAMNAVTGEGAPSYTSGVHTWNGTAETLKASPTRSRPMPTRRRASLRSTAMLVSNSVMIRVRFVEPEAP